MFGQLVLSTAIAATALLSCGGAHAQGNVQGRIVHNGPPPVVTWWYRQGPQVIIAPPQVRVWAEEPHYLVIRPVPCFEARQTYDQHANGPVTIYVRVSCH